MQLNIPKNEKAKDLFKHLPYLANQDPIFQNKVEDLLKNRKDLRKYLLATEDLNKTIEESLQLAGKLNDKTAVRHVSGRDDPLYNLFRNNDNPLDVVYRKEPKFDVQNPIIGSLLKQINKGKVTDEGIKKILDKGPDPRALDLEEKYNKIFDKEKRRGQKGLINKFFGNDDDDDDSPPGSPMVPPAPPSLPRGAYNPFGPPPPLEDTDPLIRPPREYFFSLFFKNRRQKL